MSTARQRALLRVPSDLEYRVALLPFAGSPTLVTISLRVPSDLECRVALLAVCRVAHPVDYLTPCPFGLGVQGVLARRLQGRPPC